MTEFASPLAAALQSTFQPVNTPGTGVEVPQLLLPASQIPLPILASLPSPAGGIDLRGINGSMIGTQTVNQGNSQGAQTVVIATFDKGLYELIPFILVNGSGFTLSAAAPYIARLGMLNPEGTAFGTIIADGGSNFTYTPMPMRLQFQKPGWRLAIATESTGAAQTIGVVASVYAQKLL